MLRGGRFKSQFKTNLVSWPTGPPTLLRGAKRKTLQEDERLATRGVGMGGGALNVLLPLLLGSRNLPE